MNKSGPKHLASNQSVHDTTIRRICDLPILDWDVVLTVPRRRLWCEYCGIPHLEELDWLSPHRRVTRWLCVFRANVTTDSKRT